MTKKFIKSIALALFVAVILPFAANASAAEPDILGVSALVMDMDTGEVIYSKNADDERSPASTTKLLTSLIFAENKKKSDLIAYSDNSANLTETSLNAFISGGVKAGGPVRAVVELAGISDILSKSLGSATPINVVRATIEGLKSLETVDQVAARRGKTVEEILG